MKQTCSIKITNQKTERAIASFERTHPGMIGLFCFDQSSNHQAMPEDALVASKMNLGGGGKQPKMRDGWFLRGGEKVLQKMVDEKGEPKGIKKVLQERGLWPEGKFVLDCKEGCTQGSTSCCARKTMASQSDFQSQRSALEDLVLGRGHVVEFYPKFHCETNYIERFWGEAKRRAREECDYSFAGLRERVPEILRSIPLTHIKSWRRKAWRYIHAYSIGLEGRMAEWAVKKYRSHRRIPEKMEKLVEEFMEEKKSKR